MRLDSVLLGVGGSEPVCAALGRRQCVHSLDSCVFDPFEYELCDLVADLDVEVLFAVIEEYHAHVASVVCVDHARTYADVRLQR